MFLVVVIVLIIGFCVWMEFFSDGPGEIISLDSTVFESPKSMLMALSDMALFPFRQVTWRRCLITSILIALMYCVIVPKSRSLTSFLLLMIISFVIQYMVHNFILFHGQVVKHLDYVPRIYHELLSFFKENSSIKSSEIDPKFNR